MRQIAALFVRADSVYKTMAGVDAWDEARDARRWRGGDAVVAHPPCRLWAKLRQFAKSSDPVAERQLAIDAVQVVRMFGGVIEHPAASTLWAHCGMPTPGRAPDAYGGWTAEIRQCDWGHKAEKLTWLYIVGVQPDDLPAMPPRAKPTGVIKPQRGVLRDHRKIVTKAEREHTPPAFAAWLVELARRTRIVLCGHAGEHDALLAAGWHTRTWTARKGYAATDEARENSASETLWCSPHCVPVVESQPGLFAEVAA